MNNTAYELRMKYLDTLVSDSQALLESNTIKLEQIQNNIESYIGTIEIPLGLIGPLVFDDSSKKEWVHTAVATTEGALTASMNRGAKAISECKGFRAHLVHQRMLRTPMFTFKNMREAMVFDHWIKENFEAIKEVTKGYSNYANLIDITSVVVGKIIHLKFIYTTSDASGQNMTTSCTWHACLWIDENFQKQTEVEILHFVIDGNGASDKKVSYYSIQNGRGTHVISECFLSNEVIEKTLRTTAEDMFRSYNHSMAISRFDGMIGYNINVANAIAGIFAATGQDLASIHESSTGILQMEKTDGGLYLSLSWPTLVVGTVGGGTHLPVATKILELMGCKGAGKVERFAKLIAGFALSLEISTLAAIVSGQFARAHQKMGRNKPIKWLLRSDVNQRFIEESMSYFSDKIKGVSFFKDSTLDNGILMQLTERVSKKVIGFIEFDIETEEVGRFPIIAKSKALGNEVIDGLRFMASNLSSSLADTLFNHKEFLEYQDCHKKEIEVYEALRQIGFTEIPIYYGSKVDAAREIHMLFIERLIPKDILLFNTENQPEVWTLDQKKQVISSINKVHKSFIQSRNSELIPSVDDFHPEKSIVLFKEFNQLNKRDYLDGNLSLCFQKVDRIINDWKLEKPQVFGLKTLVHNDFNSRNIAIRKTGEVCIYDWELAILNVPQRDVFEFLAFTFELNFNEDEFRTLTEFHYELVLEYNASSYTYLEYVSDLRIMGEEFLLTRVSYYLAGNTLVGYPFIERIFQVAYKMLNILTDGKS